MAVLEDPPMGVGSPHERDSIAQATSMITHSLYARIPSTDKVGVHSLRFAVRSHTVRLCTCIIGRLEGGERIRWPVTDTADQHSARVYPG